MANANDRVRVGGSGFTVFHWNNTLVAWAQEVSHTSPEPVATPVAIQPMDARRPVQVITPQAAGMGTITLTLIELYGAQVWEHLATLVGATDIVEIFERISASADPIHMTKIIEPPVLGGNRIPAYGEVYHNCVITNVANGEKIDIKTMEVHKIITVAYTRMTRDKSTRA
jgi:hypothetical protein